MEFKILPGRQAPRLEVAMTSGESYKLGIERPDSFSLVVFYRGLHCPICKTYLEALANRLSAFAELGVGVVAVSMDSRDRAMRTAKDWDIGELRVGYDLTAEDARDWGLFISESVKDSEPAYFVEPALFLIRPDGTLFSQHVQSVPFARPRWDDVTAGIRFVLEKDYPPRGTVGTRIKDRV